MLSRALRRKELQEENERVAFERTSVAISNQNSLHVESPSEGTLEQPKSQSSQLNSNAAEKSGNANISSNSASGHTGNASSDGLKWWLFLGCDQEGWTVILVLSALEAMCGIVMRAAGALKLSQPPVSNILITLGGAGFGTSVFAWVLLRFLNKKSQQDFQESTVAKSALAGSSSASTRGTDGVNSSGEVATSISGGGSKHTRRRGSSVANSFVRQWTEMTTVHHSKKSRNSHDSFVNRMKANKTCHL